MLLDAVALAVACCIAPASPRSAQVDDMLLMLLSQRLMMAQRMQV
jgi:hypothetical protein